MQMLDMQAVQADTANGSLTAAHARAAAVMTLIASHGALLHADASAASARENCQGEGDAEGNRYREQVDGLPAHEADAAAAVARAGGTAEEAGEGQSQQPAHEQGVQQGERPSGEVQPGEWAEMDEVEAGGPAAEASATAEAAADACQSRNGWEHPQHPAASATPEEPSSDPRVSEQQQGGHLGSSRAAAEVAEAREHCLRVTTCHQPYHTEMRLMAKLASQRRGI